MLEFMHSSAGLAATRQTLLTSPSALSAVFGSHFKPLRTAPPLAPGFMESLTTFMWIGVEPNDVRSLGLMNGGPSARATLKGQLLAAAAGASRRTPRPFSAPPSVSWLRRWWPALAPATVSLACAVVLAVQQTQINELEQRLQILSPAAGDAASAGP